MRKTFYKRRKNIKNKNKKTKKQMKGGLGDLGEHIFIGYKYWPRAEGFAPISIPIIVPNNYSDYSSDHSSGLFELFDLSTAINIPIPSYLLDDVKNYTVYLSQLNKIENFRVRFNNFRDRFNLYYLMSKEMIFIDSNGSIVNDDFGNEDDEDEDGIRTSSSIIKDLLNFLAECIRLKKIKNRMPSHRDTDFIEFRKQKIEQQLNWTKHMSIIHKVPYWTNNITKHSTWDDPTEKEIKEELRKTSSKELKIEFNNMIQTKYNEKITELKSILETNQKIKKKIEDLEYRYQGIIEPILLTDEVSVYNYANGAEPSVAERTDRTARVLEEGMKRI